MDPAVWEMDFMPGQFTESLYLDLGNMYEWWWDPYFDSNTSENPNPNGDQMIWQYDIAIDPNLAFKQICAQRLSPAKDC